MRSDVRKQLLDGGSHKRNTESPVSSRSRCVGMGCSAGPAEHADFREQLQVMAGVGIRSPGQGQV